MASSLSPRDYFLRALATAVIMAAIGAPVVALAPSLVYWRPQTLQMIYGCSLILSGLLALQAAYFAVVKRRDLRACSFLVGVCAAAVSGFLVSADYINTGEPSFVAPYYVVGTTSRVLGPLLILHVGATLLYLTMMQSVVAARLAVSDAILALTYILHLLTIALWLFSRLQAEYPMPLFPRPWVASAAAVIPTLLLPLVARRVSTQSRVELATVPFLADDVTQYYRYSGVLFVTSLAFSVTSALYVARQMGAGVSEALLNFSFLYTLYTTLTTTVLFSNTDQARRDAAVRATYLARVFRQCIHDVRNMLMELMAGLEEVKWDAHAIIFSTVLPSPAAAIPASPAALLQSSDCLRLPPSGLAPSATFFLAAAAAAPLFVDTGAPMADPGADGGGGECDCCLALKANMQTLLQAHTEKAQTIVEASAALLSDTLDADALLGGRVRVRYSTVGLAELMHRVMATLALRARQAYVAVVLELSPLAPVEVEVDPMRVSAIVTNLLSNAVKFASKCRNEEGGGGVVDRADGHGRVTIRVSVVEGLHDSAGEADAAASTAAGDNSEASPAASAGSSSPPSRSPGGTPSPFVLRVPLSAAAAVVTRQPASSQRNGAIAVVLPSLPTSSAPPFRAGRLFLRFEVEDNGPGIHRADLSALFVEYSQTRDGQSFANSSGLGLSIVRDTVELLGGAITVQSCTSSARTVFAITLPVGKVAEPATTPGSIGDAAGDASRIALSAVELGEVVVPEALGQGQGSSWGAGAAKSLARRATLFSRRQHSGATSTSSWDGGALPSTSPFNYGGGGGGGGKWCAVASNSGDGGPADAHVHAVTGGSDGDGGGSSSSSSSAAELEQGRWGTPTRLAEQGSATHRGGADSRSCSPVALTRAGSVSSSPPFSYQSGSPRSSGGWGSGTPLVLTGPPPTFLVCDDSSVIRRFVVNMLRRVATTGVVEEACNGLEAVAAVGARLTPFTAIFMDGSMPVCDGYAAVRAMRHSGCTSYIAGLTGDPEGSAAFQAAGAETTLFKPLDMAAFRAVVVAAAAAAASEAVAPATAAVAAAEESAAAAAAADESAAAAAAPAAAFLLTPPY